MYKKNFENCAKLIGNTPFVKINFLYKGKPCHIFAKLEYYNLTGSIKDRAVLYMLEQAYAKGELKKGDKVVEATSGNTGISLSAIASMLGNDAEIFMPDWLSIERQNLMRSYGAKLNLISREEGGFLTAISQAKDMAKNDNVYMLQQFSNVDNTKAHYLSTGLEILNGLKKHGLNIDAFVAGAGTGGTIMGVAKRLRENNPDVKVFPIKPKSSLNCEVKLGGHKIEGIFDDFIPDLLKLDELDKTIHINDNDAIIMAQKISKELGIGVGISSGANFLGAVSLQESNKVVATIFCDDNKKYFSTDYAKVIEPKEDYISTDIKLIDFEVL